MNKTLITKYSILLIIVTLIASLIPVMTFKLFIFFDENNVMASSVLLAHLGILILIIVSFIHMIKFLIKAKTMTDIIPMALVFIMILALWKIISIIYAGFGMN